MLRSRVLMLGNSVFIAPFIPKSYKFYALILKMENNSDGHAYYVVGDAFVVATAVAD